MNDIASTVVKFRSIILLLVLVNLTGCNVKDTKVFPSQTLHLQSGWNLHSDTLKTIPAQIPGTVHTDLLDAGIISDPFYNQQEEALRWIEEKDWVYSCEFEINDSLLNYATANLVFEGLDTEATIYLNDEELLTTDNMFRAWRVPVKANLNAGKNTLRVRFESTVNKYAHASDSLGFVYPADSDDSKTAPFVRKAAYHFGWDWAPRFVTCGIWKPVYLEFHLTARIDDVRIEQRELTDNNAKIHVEVNIDQFRESPLEIEVNGTRKTIQSKNGKHTANVDFEIKNPELWWPNGSGEQKLYSIPIKLFQNGMVIDFTYKTIGLRTVELVNEPDSIGTSFYFKVNGKPIFMQGANYVPQDVFLPRVKPEQYRQLLIAAKEAHMNMIRVWGGGVYERDLFYDLCDSLGLLVWQDFMFAGTMYPGDSAFVQNVSKEVRQQIKRLRHHPSMAIWCGNNELEVAWYNWGWQERYNYSPADSAKMWKDYLRLFHDVIPEIVKQESPDIAYVPTSPQSNWGTAENFNHGSMHYWGVWHGREPISAFEKNVGRFMVEYGMQSYPALETLREFISEDELHLGSKVLNSRQKSYIGDEEIWRHLHDNGLDPQNLNEFIAASQAVQSEALRTAIHAHKNSNGHGMGTLFWQLNDCWPGVVECD